MRISDWRSDVCSSDLAPSGYALHRRGVLPDICTTGEVTSPADVMARIQTGALPISADLRRLEVDTEDDEAVEALRAHCPTREGDEDIDMTVARNLMEDPVLYARAPHSVADKTGRASGGGSVCQSE